MLPKTSGRTPSAIIGGGRHLSGSPEQEGRSGGEDNTGTKTGVVAGGHNYGTSMRKEKDTNTRNTQKQSNSLRN